MTTSQAAKNGLLSVPFCNLGSGLYVEHSGFKRGQSLGNKETG